MLENTNDFEEEQEKVKFNVVKILLEFPECRSSDDVLEIYYRYYYDKLKQFIPKEVIFGLTKGGTITRSRRKIQEEAREKLRKHEEGISILTDKKKEYFESLLPSEKSEELLAIREEEFRTYYKKKEED